MCHRSTKRSMLLVESLLVLFRFFWFLRLGLRHSVLRIIDSMRLMNKSVLTLKEPEISFFVLFHAEQRFCTDHFLRFFFIGLNTILRKRESGFFSLTGTVPNELVTAITVRNAAGAILTARLGIRMSIFCSCGFDDMRKSICDGWRTFRSTMIEQCPSIIVWFSYAIFHFGFCITSTT